MRKRIWYTAAVVALAVTATTALTFHAYHNPQGQAARYARKFTREVRRLSPVTDLVPAARNLMAPIHQGIQAEETVVLSGMDEDCLVPADPVPVEGAIIPLDAGAIGEIAPLVIPDPTLTPESCEPFSEADPDAQPPVSPPTQAPAAMPYCTEEGPPPMPRAPDGEKGTPKAAPKKVERIPVMPRCDEEGETGRPNKGQTKTKQLLRKLHRLYKGYSEHRPIHPEVDTMEFRPTDARRADFRFGPLF